MQSITMLKLCMLVAIGLLAICVAPAATDEGEDEQFYYQKGRAAAWIPDQNTMPVIRGILFHGNGACRDSRHTVRNLFLQEWAVQHGFVIVGMQAGNFCNDEH